MAESNATQVILTDDGLKIIKAQNTADNAASGVANLNDPNLMSGIEKQTVASQYAGLTSQYNVILARAKDANISTTALTTAYANLKAFMTAILTDTTKASDVDRDTYKSLTDAYNMALSNVQTALSNSYNTDIDNMQSNVSVASQAASSAVIVASQAAATGNNASQVASQAASAANQASTDYTALSAGVKDGSVVHITTKTVIDSAVIGTAEIVDAAITDAKVGDISANKLTAGTIDFNTITGTNINASNITTGTLATDRLNVNKLSALSANLGDVTTGSLKGVDIVANTFSTPNGSFTTDSNGNVVAKNMTLNGGTLTSPTINAGVINGSTINGTTFNAGTKLNQFGNTSYPLTINPDGSLTSTSFKSIATENAALRTVIKDGTVKTGLRGMTQFSSGMYSAADVSLGAGQLVLLEGYSTSPDPNFTANNLKTTGYSILDATTGLSLHGTTQSINFSGTDKDQSTGITMNSYGNIYAQPNSSWWRIGSFNGTQIINVGIDTAGKNDIEFKRDINIGNISINRAHSIISNDGGGLYINSGIGGRADLNVASLNYTGSVSKSLLSEKKDVKKVDTSYWAQLVNSIDLATYQYKDDDNTSNLRLSGIVDDVNENKQWNLPDIFVARDEDGKLAGIENIVLQNAMLATIQEQQKEIDKLNGHLLKLEAKLNG